MDPIASPWRGIRPWRRHSLVLLVAGSVYIGTGASYILATPTETREVALQVALYWFPLDVWGWFFVTAGVLSIISSRWPPISETWGYTVLTGLSAAWASSYALSVVFGDSPTTNISGAAVWGLIAFLWWAISGLNNPDNVVVIPSESE